MGILPVLPFALLSLLQTPSICQPALEHDTLESQCPQRNISLHRILSEHPVGNASSGHMNLSKPLMEALHLRGVWVVV